MKSTNGLLAQLVEHIVHIDGVTGSSPVQTTKKPSARTDRGFTHSLPAAKGRDDMTGFIPKLKMNKKARKQLDAQQRTTWSFSPVTKSVDSAKRYDRRKKPHVRDIDGNVGFFYAKPSGRRAAL